MAWTKVKTAIVVGTCVLLGVGTTTVAIKAISDHNALKGRTESEWIKGIAYFGDDNQLNQWRSLGSRGVRMLMRALNSPTNDHSTRMCVASVLQQLANRNELEYFPQVLESLKTEKDDGVRAIEIECFNLPFDKMPKRDRLVLFPELIRGLDSRDTSVRNNSIVILQHYKDRTDEVIPLIQEKLQDPIPAVRVMAVTALMKIDPENSAKSDLVVVAAQCVTDPPGNAPGADNNAVILLGELHRKPEVAVPVLIQALQNENSYVRANSAAALGKFGIEARPAIDALTKALQDSDNSVRNQARAALRRINSGAAPG